MAVKTRSAIKAENVSDLPDNTAGLISASDLRGQLDDIIDSATFPEDGGGGSGSGSTVDTGEPFKIIMLSDGTVRAIPIAVMPPIPPASLTGLTGVSSVRLSWPVTAGAVSFYVYRDGQFLTETGYQSYIDTTVTLGHTYEYRVATVDIYGQVSPRSVAVTAVIDISLNHPPQDVVITAWPLPLPTDGPAFIRVNAWDIDVHNLAFTLGIDVGSLQATGDPTTWVIRI